MDGDRVRMLEPVREHAQAQPLATKDAGRLECWIMGLGLQLRASFDSGYEGSYPAAARAELRNIEAFLRSAYQARSEDLDAHGRAQDIGSFLQAAGDTRRQLGHSSATIQLYEEALAVFRKICVGKDTDNDNRRDVGVALARLSQLHGELEDGKSSIECAQESVEVFAEVGKLDKSEFATNDYIISLHKLADAQRVNGELNASLRTAERAIYWGEKVCARSNKLPDSIFSLGISYEKKGFALLLTAIRDKNDRIKAEAMYAFGRRHAIIEALLKQFPSVAKVRRDYAMSCLRMADAYRFSRMFYESAAALREARDLLRETYEQDKASFTATYDMFVSLNKLRDVYFILEDLDNASRAMEELRLVEENMRRLQSASGSQG